jgi:DNA-binding transcriptional MerR regulator
VQPPRRYRLRELARLVGLEPRTIRSYIQQGVIPGPDRRGRNARYGLAHVDRLRAVVFLRSQRGLSLPAIRAVLLSLSDPQIHALPTDRRVLDTMAGSGMLPLAASAIYPRAGSWSDRAGLVAERSDESVDDSQKAPAPPVWAWWAPRPRSARSPRQVTAFDGLLNRLQQAVVAQNVPQVAKGEPWVRIPITPDVELSVRNVAGPEAFGALVRIADHIRYLLLHASPARTKSRKRS